MAGAFQKNAFQNNAFQTGRFLASATTLQLPVNCVMIGQQLYTGTGRTVEFNPPRIRTVPRMSVGRSRGND